MHRIELKVKITSVENVRKMQKIYLYDRAAEEKAKEAWALVKLYQESNDKVG